MFLIKNDNDFLKECGNPEKDIIRLCIEFEKLKLEKKKKIKWVTFKMKNNQLTRDF